MTTTDNVKEIRIYVANLGKYNEGELVGDWFSLPTELEEIKKVIGVADGTQYEEWAIHDYEAHFKIGEHEDIEALNEIAEKFESLDKWEVLSVIKVVEDGIYSDIIEAIENNVLENMIFYHGCDDMADVAFEINDQNETLKEDHPLYNYIDWERVGRDLEIEGKFWFLGNDEGYRDTGVWAEYIG